MSQNEWPDRGIFSGVVFQFEISELVHFNDNQNGCSWWRSRAQLCPVSSLLQVIARECGDRRGEFDTLSNLLFHNYFQLREFSEPAVFSVLRDPKEIPPSHVFVQPVPKPIQTLCTYGFHWQEVSQAYHHHFWFYFAPSPCYLYLQAPTSLTGRSNYSFFIFFLPLWFSSSRLSPLTPILFFQRDDISLLILSAKTMGNFPGFGPPIFPEPSPKIGAQETQQYIISISFPVCRWYLFVDCWSCCHDRKIDKEWLVRLGNI